MNYVALLRGINVGTTNRIPMSQLISIWVQLGYSRVSSYINSGNLFFQSPLSADRLQEEISQRLVSELGVRIPTLVKSLEQCRQIVDAIPPDWVNDDTQRTDVAYLFAEADHEDILAQVPMRREVIDVRYTLGAVFWNFRRDVYTKTHLNKLISHPLYQQMTVRNINTARYLAAFQL